jgi:hypothetical protein|tara:strand:+ start:2363 stop:2530 length:168 start_codon:yes stop_codon:yes gene_type:complete
MVKLLTHVCRACPIYIVDYRSVISSISSISDLTFEFSDLIRAEYNGRFPYWKERN